MLVNTSQTLLRGTLAGAIAAVGLAICPPLHAQPMDQGYYGDQSYSDQDTTLGGITVHARPYSNERAYGTNAPIETVSTSRYVDVSDLDLNTRWGWHEMHARVANAAQEACDDLDTMYPATASDSPPCVRTAVREAMRSVDYNDDGE